MLRRPLIQSGEHPVLVTDNPTNKQTDRRCIRNLFHCKLRLSCKRAKNVYLPFLSSQDSVDCSRNSKVYKYVTVMTNCRVSRSRIQSKYVSWQILKNVLINNNYATLVVPRDRIHSRSSSRSDLTELTHQLAHLQSKTGN